MNYLERVELWGNNHHPKQLDYLRIVLGLILCYKAILFLVNMSGLMDIMQAATNKDMSAFAMVFFGQFIVIVTLLSGIFLVFGIHTRLICAIQIPLLIGAVVFLNRAGNNTFEIILTIITLILLIVFLIAGNGPLSYSRMFREEDKAYRDTH